MHPGVLTCTLDTPLREVARIMASHRVHCVVVFGGDEEMLGGRIWGVVSDLDLVSVAAVEELEKRTAGGTAVTPVVMVSPHDTLEHAAQLMREHEVTHLLVVDETTARPVGVLSTLDIARELALGA
jgi:CBS domain-containing protein